MNDIVKVNGELLTVLIKDTHLWFSLIVIKSATLTLFSLIIRATNGSSRSRTRFWLTIEEHLGLFQFPLCTFVTSI